MTAIVRFRKSGDVNIARTVALAAEVYRASGEWFSAERIQARLAGEAGTLLECDSIASALAQLTRNRGDVERKGGQYRWKEQ